MTRRVGLAVALFTAALAWRFLTFTGFTNDQYGHLALAHQLLLGDRPIRDFFDPGWPLQYLVSAGAWQLTGGAMVGEWAVAALALAAGAALTALAAYRLSGSIAVAAIVTIAEILIAPRLYSYPKILPYAAAAWVMVSAHGAPSRRRICVLGFIVAAGFLFRHDHGLYLGAAAAVYVAVAAHRGLQPAVAAVATLATATLACLIPWLLYVAMNGGIVSYFRLGIEFAGREVNATVLDYLPVFSTTPAVITADNAVALVFWLFWLAPMLCAGMLVVRLRSSAGRWPGEGAAMTGLLTLALCVNAGFIRHELPTRLPDAIVPAALLGAWAFAVSRGRSATRAAVVGVFVIALPAIVVIGNVPEEIDRIGMTRGVEPVLGRVREVATLLGLPHRQTVSPPGRVSETLMPFYEYLDRCSSPDDRLIVTSASPDVPVLAGRRFAGDGAAFSSGYTPVSGQTRTLERLRAAPPLFVVAIDRAEFDERYPLVAEYVGAEFEQMAVVSGTLPDPVPILVHRARSPAGTDLQTGWPCFSTGR